MFTKSKKIISVTLSLLIGLNPFMVQAANEYRVPIKSLQVAPPAGSAPVATFSTANLNFGAHPVGNSTSLGVLLTNTGTAPLNLPTAASSTGAAYSVSTSCGSSLSVGASCNYSVNFSPLTGGTHIGSVSIPTTLGTHVVSLTGSGQAAQGDLSSTSYNFGPVALNSLTEGGTIRFTNTGSATLTISPALSASGSADFSQTSTNCATSLSPGGFCDTVLRYQPTTVAAHSTTYTFNTNVGTYSFTITGSGVGAELNVSNTSVDFNTVTVGANTSQIVTIQNTGAIPLTFSSAPQVSGSAAITRTSTCGASLNANASCSVTITFTPTVSGAVSSALTINTSAGNSVVNISGTGVTVLPAVTPTSLNFGNQLINSTTDLGVTVSNNGTGTLNIAGLALTGDSAFSISASQCGTTLSTGASCIATIRYAPTTVGANTSTLNITTNGGNFSIPITGNSAAALVSMSTNSVSIDNVLVGATATRSVVLSNIGTTNVTFPSSASLAGSGAIGSLSTNCPVTLTPSNTCTYSFAYTPSVISAVAANLTIPTNAGTQTVAISGTGASLSATTSTYAGATNGTVVVSSPNLTDLQTATVMYLMTGNTIISTSSSVSFNSGTGALTGTFATVPSATGYTVRVSSGATVLGTTTVTIPNPIKLEFLDTSNNLISNLDYGVVPPDTDRTIRLSNWSSSRATLTITNVATSGAPFTIQSIGGAVGGATCASATNIVLPVGAYCTIVVRVSGPQGTYNSFDVLNVTSNAETSNVSFGTPVAFPLLAVLTEAPFTWTQSNQLPANTGNWINVGSSGTSFVAVANNSATAAYSADGVTWSATTLPAQDLYRGVAGGGGTYIAVVSNSSTWARSTNNGLTWSSLTVPTTRFWSSITYGNGIFVAADNQAAGNVLSSSNNGTSWTASTTSVNTASILYGNGLFLALPGDGETNYATTTNGSSWTLRTLPSAVNGSTFGAYGNGVFVVVQNGSNTIFRSTTGTGGWTTSAFSSTYGIGSWRVSYGNGKFVAIRTGSNISLTSTDGITWTQTTSLPSSDNWTNVVYGVSKFVTTGASAANRRAAYSN